MALKTLGAKGSTEQVTRVLVPSLPVASVLAVGLGKDRDEWRPTSSAPRRVAARSSTAPRPS